MTLAAILFFTPGIIGALWIIAGAYRAARKYNRRTMSRAHPSFWGDSAKRSVDAKRYMTTGRFQ